MNNKCKICDSQKLSSLYHVENLPLFQNKVYNSFEGANSQKVVGVDLCQCQDCGFVFNALFTSEEMDYDDSYQNEQNYSQSFVEHLNSVVDYLVENGFQDKKIVEIGCGKGYFTELLEKKSFKHIYGFDPAYEGDNPNITKDYFGEKYKSINADLVILRHVLEHIENPYEFLKHIQKATSKHTKILIEVPAFEWIVENEAFWDIFYEHCNYFDGLFLSSFFENATTKKVFGSQYILMLANLQELKAPLVQHKYPEKIFDKSIRSIKTFLSKHTPLVIWGGASKGVTLLNIFDKNKQFVDYCIDINPKKQNMFIATTGHKILSPESLGAKKEEVSILVVNQNYYDEIVQEYNNKKNFKFYSLEKIINKRKKMTEIEKFSQECQERVSLNAKDEKLLESTKNFSNETLRAGYSYNFSWLGRPIIQYPQDMMALQEIIWEVKPDMIIETGIAHGGSLIFSASMLTLLEACGEIEDGKVLGIDIDIREHNRKAIEAHPISQKITMFQGSSIDEEMIAKVHAFAEQGKKIMVILDSNHTHEHVLAELRAYAHLVSIGSYCCTYDTIVEDMPEGSFSDRPWDIGNNPKTAVWEYLKECYDFVIDKNIENKILITVAPDGYLKRVR